MNTFNKPAEPRQYPLSGGANSSNGWITRRRLLLFALLVAAIAIAGTALIMQQNAIRDLEATQDALQDTQSALKSMIEATASSDLSEAEQTSVAAVAQGVAQQYLDEHILPPALVPTEEVQDIQSATEAVPTALPTSEETINRTDMPSTLAIWTTEDNPIVFAGSQTPLPLMIYNSSDQPEDIMLSVTAGGFATIQEGCPGRTRYWMPLRAGGAYSTVYYCPPQDMTNALGIVVINVTGQSSGAIAEYEIEVRRDWLKTKFTAYPLFNLNPQEFGSNCAGLDLTRGFFPIVLSLETQSGRHIDQIYDVKLTAEPAGIYYVIGENSRCASVLSSGKELVPGESFRVIYQPPVEQPNSLVAGEVVPAWLNFQALSQEALPQMLMINLGDNVNVRDQPSTRGGTIETLNANTVAILPVLDREGEGNDLWYQVSLGDGRTGWVFNTLGTLIGGS